MSRTRTYKRPKDVVPTPTFASLLDGAGEIQMRDGRVRYTRTYLGWDWVRG